MHAIARRSAAVGGITALLMIAAACNSSGGGKSSGDAGSSGNGSLPASITVHAISDQSGANAAVGQSELNGWKLAVADIAKQGILGKSKIELTSDDTQSATNQAASLASQAVSKKYDLVTYGPSSALAVVMAPIFSRSKQNTIFVQAGSSGVVVGPTIFRLTPTLDTFYPLALKYLQGKNVKTLADIYLNDNPTYTGIDKLLGDQASTYGYTHTGNVAVATTQTNVSAAVSKLAGMKTDAVAVLMNGAPAASVVGQLRQLGYQGQIIAAPNIGANNVLAAVGSAGNGVVWPTDWAATSTVQASKDFVSSYQATYNKMPDVYAAEAYDSLFFFANALKKYGGSNAGAITKAMTDLGNSGFAGVLGDKLTVKDGSEVSPGQLVQWQDGQIVAVNG